MQDNSHSLKRRIEAITGIVYRNVVVLINAIIFSVVVLLWIFGDAQEGFFLGTITLLNIIIGCTQEIHAWLALEKLQLLLVAKVIRVDARKKETEIFIEEISVHDHIKLKIGDQVPCDGIILESHGFEVNEALITGESKAYGKIEGDQVLAGSIITSGTGTIEIQKTFAESRIALMTKSIKKYTLVLSPIQSSIHTLIHFAGYLLLLIITVVVGRGLIIHESTIAVVQTIGALTSALLPQGIVLIVTLIFSYGAAYLYKRNVLLQEINATEKMARIKNLCMDKTGTLTDNIVAVESMHTASSIEKNHAATSIAGYLHVTEDLSQTVVAVRKFSTQTYEGTVIDDISFSSSRRFGAVQMKDKYGERVVFMGAPDIFLEHVTRGKDKQWIQKFIDTKAQMGKRLVCFAESNLKQVPDSLAGVDLYVVSMCVLTNNLRDGVKESVAFFQDRGVIIRIISGDSPETVAAVAREAGVKNTSSVVTGSELEALSDLDFEKYVHMYSIFARIKPEQKEKIIETLKKDGFTAMVGDGANDALAIKKADLGIAMFDGAQATRQVASIVLVKNSFMDLPNGVKLADSVIQNIEIASAIVFNQVILELFFFVALTSLGYSFPFTPLNITFINYFTVGMPGLLIFYWIIRPTHVQVLRQDESFLRRVLPFASISAIPQLIVVMLAYYDFSENLLAHGSAGLIALSRIVSGVIFFMFTLSVYSGPVTKSQRVQFIGLTLLEILSFLALLSIPFVANFYNLHMPLIMSVLSLLPVFFVYAVIQFGLTRRLFITRKHTSRNDSFFVSHSGTKIG